MCARPTTRCRNFALRRQIEQDCEMAGSPGREYGRMPGDIYSEVDGHGGAASGPLRRTDIEPPLAGVLLVEHKAWRWGE